MVSVIDMMPILETVAAQRNDSYVDENVLLNHCWVLSSSGRFFFGPSKYFRFRFRFLQYYQGASMSKIIS